jgi:hypothetical protein
MFQQGQVFKLKVKGADGEPLRTGNPVLAVSRFIGSSISMIDRHQGHLARDNHVRAVSLLDALALDRGWPPGDVEPKPPKRAQQHRFKTLPETRDGRWTLGGRQVSFSAPEPTTREADHEEVPEAL